MVYYVLPLSAADTSVYTQLVPVEPVGTDGEKARVRCVVPTMFE